jgi:hypothetical protein
VPGSGSGWSEPRGTGPRPAGGPGTGWPGLASTSVTASERPAPRLAPAAAVGRLEALGQPFVFFVNRETGRGSLVYHRYDGHYRLVAPGFTALGPGPA